MGLGEIKATSGAPTRQAAYNVELHTQAPENKPCFVPDLFGSRPVCCSPRHSSAFRRRHPTRRRCRNALNKPPRLPHRRMTTAFCSAGQPSCAPRIVGSWTPPWKRRPGIQEQTLSFVIKLFAVIGTLLVIGGWIGAQIFAYASTIFSNFATWQNQ